MPAAAALKRRPRPETVAAPPIPDERIALHDAIERKRKADRAIEAQHEAIHRAYALIEKSEQDIAALEAKIPDADLSDVRSAASLVKANKTVAAPWHGENARHAVESGEGAFVADGTSPQAIARRPRGHGRR